MTAVLVAGATMATLHPVAAQSAGTDPSSAPDALTEVTVTGSRIVRKDLDSPAPIAVVGESEIRDRGPVTLDSVLNLQPQLKPDNGLSQNFTGGSGVIKANLRGLGPTRTLVLVDGRRYTPADATGAVDLATVPQALLERIEILTGGASAVYGSDAVAGAVNFVLRKYFEGLRVDASYGQSAKSDAQTRSVSVLMGGNFAERRGNAVVGVDWHDSSEVLFGDRAFAATPVDENPGHTALVYAGSTAIPGGLTLAGSTPFVGVPPRSCPTDSTARGVAYGAGGVPGVFCLPADTYNYAPPNFLVRPMQRWQLSGLAHYAISPSVEAFTDLFYTNTGNQQQVAPGAGALTLTLPNYAANAALPLATRIFLQQNAAIFDARNTGTATVTIRRRFSELGNRFTDYGRDAFSATAGLRGDLDLLGAEPWKWELFYQYQKSSTTETYRGQVDGARIQLGSSVNVGGGSVSCASSLIAGCVPVNLFGVDSLTPAMAIWSSPEYSNKSAFRRDVAGASLSGTPFALPAGEVSLAAGLEYRKESYAFDPSPLAYNGEILNINTGPPTLGSFNVKEVFLETRVPIVERVAALEGGVRRSDYSNRGIGAVNTFKLGGDIRPATWLKFRAMYNRAIRAPNLNELYSAVSVTNLSIVDRCNAATNPAAAVQQLCVAQGVPAALLPTFQQINPFAPVSKGGNVGLNAEAATTKTGGVVLSFPDHDFNASLDYWDIKVSDAISAISQQSILDTCFATNDISSTYCRAIRRDADGQLSMVSANFANLAKRRLSGLDLAVDYAVTSERFGFGDRGSRVKFTLQATRQFKDETVAFANQAAIDCVGRYGSICSGLAISMTPKTRVLAGASWTSGPATVSTDVSWIDSFRPLSGTSLAVTRIPAIAYVDLNAGYRLSDSLQLTAGLQNAFNRQPTVVGFTVAGDPNVDPSLYDVVGRRWFLTLSAKM